MKSLNYWEQFALSGRVEDYLNYVIRTREEESNAETGGVNEKVVGKYTADMCDEGTGVRLDAGICISDRNHIEADTCRRI